MCAGAVQRDRRGEDVGVACHARPESLARLSNFLLGEPHAFLRRSDGFACGCEIQQSGSHLDGRLLANEFAPRVHNTAHWTIDGAATSQFENHVRAILGLPLGSTELRAPSVMVNLIGSMPPLAELLALPNARVHLYGKEPRAGRKVGHVTLLEPADETVDRALALAGAGD